MSVLLAAYYYYSGSLAGARAEVEQELNTVADLKLRQISHWREERLADARFFSRARFVAEDLKRFFEAPSSEEARSAVTYWLSLLKGDERYYAVMVFDAELHRRLTIPDSASEPPATLRALVEKARKSGDVVMTDLHQDETQSLIHLDVLVPVFAEAEPKKGPLVGVVLLGLDPRQFLFPLVQSWPTPSRTAETLLVRPEGADVLYLNELRHRVGSALSLRQPLAMPSLDAARFLRGETNLIEALDYRGVPVVAVGRLVPSTPWAMVAKVDRAELYATWHHQLRAALLLLATVLGAGALLIALLWNRHRARLLQQDLARERMQVTQLEEHERRRQAAEEALRLARDELEVRVQERTADLQKSNEALARASTEREQRGQEISRLNRELNLRLAQLQSSNAELESFAYSVSHDLRAPLRAIAGYSMALQEDCAESLDGAGMSKLLSIRAAGQRMDQLIKDLLRLSQVSQGDLWQTHVDMTKLAQSIVAGLRTTDPHRSAEVVIAPGLAAKADPNLVRIVLENLLGNAWKFTSRIPQARIEFGQLAQNGRATFYIRDNGAGFDAAYAKKLFGPFQRLHSQAEFPGTGIGLATVQRVVHRHGGRVWAEGSVGQGACFYFELPMES